MASAITGINRGVAAELESSGPKTFFVFRFFQGGLDICDGSDEMSPWRRNPWLTIDEAELLRRLPRCRTSAIGECTGGPVSYGEVKLTERAASSGYSRQLDAGHGRRPSSPGGTSPTSEYAAGAQRRRDQRQAGRDAVPRASTRSASGSRSTASLRVIGIYAEAASALRRTATSPRWR